MPLLLSDHFVLMKMSVVNLQNKTKTKKTKKKERKRQQLWNEMGQKWFCSKEWLLPPFTEECRVQFLKLEINLYFTQTGIFSMAGLLQKTNNKQKCSISWSQIAGSVLEHLRIC